MWGWYSQSRFLGVPVGCGASFPRHCFPASFVAFSFDLEDEKRAVDGWRWFRAAVLGVRVVVNCLFSPVTHGGSHGCFGTVWCAPTLEDSTRSCSLFLLLFVSQQGVHRGAVMPRERQVGG